MVAMRATGSLVFVNKPSSWVMMRLYRPSFLDVSMRIKIAFKGTKFQLKSYPELLITINKRDFPYATGAIYTLVFHPALPAYVSSFPFHFHF